MFSIKNFKNTQLKKIFFYKFTNFFKIVDVINAQIYQLQLSKKLKIYFVFYIFLFELYYENVNATKSKNIILINKNEKYEIKTILNSKIK